MPDDAGSPDPDLDPGPIDADSGASGRRDRRVSAAGLHVALAGGREPPPPPVAFVNMSVSGAAIVAPWPLGSEADDIDVEVRSAPDGEPVSYHCQICYLLGERRSDGDEPRWLHGVRFHRLLPAAQRFARLWVERGSGI